MGKIIGIDLGTTNSCVAFCDASGPYIIKNAQGESTSPSVVAITSKNEVLIGAAAKRQMAVNNNGTIVSVKRKMGSNEKIDLRGNIFSPEEISALILSQLKQYASLALNEDISEAVITVPAYFTDAQRQATAAAGKMAGLDVKRIINEPTAAALAYGIDSQEEQTVIVYDLGGGTFDISVLRLSDHVFEVLATLGDNMLGGDDFDKVLTDFILNKVEAKNNVKIKDTAAIYRLTEAAEKAKIELSSLESTDIAIPFLTVVDGEPIHVKMSIMRKEFENLIQPFIKKTIDMLKQAIKEAGISYSDISHVLLVGGSTKIPFVTESIKESIGITPNNEINPDECVAVGAAIQGANLNGTLQGFDLLLLDVTPLSLGVETKGGFFSKVIAKNTKIPCRQSKIFSTARDNQTEVKIKVYQGEREFAKDNKLLGNFLLTSIEPAPMGYTKIEVIFDIDANGIVSITAKDKKSGNEQHIQISNITSMSASEINQAIIDAENHKTIDSRQKEEIELKEIAATVIRCADPCLRQNIDGAKLRKLKEKRNELILMCKGDVEDLDKLRLRINNLDNLISECLMLASTEIADLTTTD